MGIADGGDGLGNSRFSVSTVVNVDRIWVSFSHIQLRRQVGLRRRCCKLGSKAGCMSDALHRGLLLGGYISTHQRTSTHSTVCTLHPCPRYIELLDGVKRQGGEVLYQPGYPSVGRLMPGPSLLPCCANLCEWPLEGMEKPLRSRRLLHRMLDRSTGQTVGCITNAAAE